MQMKARKLGNSEVGNRQKGNSSLLAFGFWLFTTSNRKLYIPPFSVEKLRR